MQAMPFRAAAPRLCLAAALLLLAAPAARAQAPAPAPQPASSAGAPPVSLPVSVYDKKERPLPGLTPSELRLQVDGAPQAVASFTPAGGLPLALALDFETGRAAGSMLDPERSAAHDLLDRILTTPGDQAAVLHFDREVELLQDLTANKGALANALDELGPTPPPADEDEQQRRHPGNDLYDSIYLAAHDVLASRTGRKAIVVVSDGEDRGSQESLHDAIAAAQRAQVVVYAIYFEGEKHYPSTRTGSGGYPRHGGMGYPGGYPGGGYPGGYPGGGYPGGYPGGGYPGGGYPGGSGPAPAPASRGNGKKIMQQLAGDTGGDFFEIRKKENYDQAFQQIAGRLRTQYRLTFSPTPAQSAPGYHALSLTTTKKDLLLQAPGGYYSKADASTPR